MATGVALGGVTRPGGWGGGLGAPRRRPTREGRRSRRGSDRYRRDRPTPNPDPDPNPDAVPAPRTVALEWCGPSSTLRPELRSNGDLLGGSGRETRRRRPVPALPSPSSPALDSRLSTSSRKCPSGPGVPIGSQTDLFSLLPPTPPHLRTPPIAGPAHLPAGRRAGPRDTASEDRPPAGTTAPPEVGVGPADGGGALMPLIRRGSGQAAAFDGGGVVGGRPGGGRGRRRPGGRRAGGRRRGWSAPGGGCEAGVGLGVGGWESGKDREATVPRRPARSSDPQP